MTQNNITLDTLTLIEAKRLINVELDNYIKSLAGTKILVNKIPPQALIPGVNFAIKALEKVIEERL